MTGGVGDGRRETGRRETGDRETDFAYTQLLRPRSGLMNLAVAFRPREVGAQPRRVATPELDAHINRRYATRSRFASSRGLKATARFILSLTRQLYIFDNPYIKFVVSYMF